MMYLLDYTGEKLELNDFDIDDILLAWIEVKSGDEVLRWVDRNLERHTIDAGSRRMVDYFDGEYDIIKDGKFVVDPAFHNRTESYW